MNTRNVLITALVSVGLISACASTPPKELVEARTAYQTASTGIAAKQTPADLYEAKKSLDAANAAFERDGDTDVVKDQAYVATRRAQLAEAKARTSIERMRIEEARKAGVTIRDTQVKMTQEELAKARQELEAVRSQGQLTAQQLEAEKAARLAAEERIAGLMKDLQTIAAVKEEARGLVITLSGSVLFASNKSALLESAKTRLNQVATALLADDKGDKKMVVEGHTDSHGSEEKNMILSRKRAEAVREYLISQKIPAERISAEGLGESRPVADNKTAEGRANNRRVEIVIGGGTGTGNASATSTTGQTTP